MVKPGYKQTEIGVIPEDWKVVSLGEKVDIFRGGSPRPIQDYLTQADNGVNWIKIGDVPVNGKYVRATEEKIRPEGVLRSREVHSGDFILSNSMSFGRPYILAINGCIHDGWLTIQNYEGAFLKEYLYYLLSSNTVFSQYIAMAAGSSVKNLNKEKVGSLIVAFPRNLSEQRRIAEALSDMDELITSLEKLIAKKKAIKQGVMQELLTGKRRLPGFSEEWESTSLAALCTVITDGSHESPPEVAYGYYMPSVKDMTNRGFNYSNCKQISKNDYEKLARNGCQPVTGDVLIAKDGSILKYTFVYKQERPTVILSSIAITRPNKAKICSHYLAHYFRQNSFIENVILNYKTGTGVPRIVLNCFKKIEIFYPATIKEQTEISMILSNMDSEIYTIEEKLNKAFQIKKAMMQQLLTGKIRLM